ncbi:hypothetical protein [Sulfitobacter sp. 20_GPM-1509m]|uniref:hypothetical protein n=1 Tax=Sulfitobacter sp. 20_GPM-1509m TaxID=1380367 RepID=UPI000A7FABC2|nr:hypothetical protein [Sulfitobacter sp. 20_GPM-1509m]
MEIARDVELGEFDKTPEVAEATAETPGEMIPKFIKLHAKPNTKDWKRTESVLHKFDGLKDRPIDQIKRQDDPSDDWDAVRTKVTNAMSVAL